MSFVIDRVAVVGAGVMGAGIAQVLAVAGCRVALVDVEPGQLETAMDTIARGPFGLDRSVLRGRLSDTQARNAAGAICPTTDLGLACADAQVVIEAVPEDIGLKVRVFRDLDRRCPPDTILASNTGGLSITALAYATDRPTRVLGWHFSQPVPAMALAELVTHAGTDSTVVDTVSELAARCGKNPIVVSESQRSWGFVVNRINRAVRREAAQIVTEGVATPEQVDQLIKDAFRWPMGPFEMEGARVIGPAS